MSNLDESTLSAYLTKLYEDWGKNRKAALESKWQRNIDAFKGNVGNNSHWKKEDDKNWTSDTFINITKQKVIAGFSLVIDILLQGGKIPFGLELAPESGMDFDKLPDEQRSAIEEDIEDMTKLIEQQLADCKIEKTFMQNILSSSIYGSTIDKWRIIDIENEGYRVVLPEGIEDITTISPENIRHEYFSETRTSPGIEFCSVWDIFRDLENDNLQEGKGIFHRQLKSPYFIRSKIGKPHYITPTIERILKNDETEKLENTDSLAPHLREIANRQNDMTICEWWGRVPKNIAIEFEKELMGEENVESFDDTGNPGDEVEIMAMNLISSSGTNEIIRYKRNPSGKRPFYRSIWQEYIDDLAAVGVADNIEGSQKVINNGVRKFENNKALTTNFILAIKRELLETDLKKFEPGMEIDVAEECEDVRKAIQQVIFKDVGDSLISFIGMFEKFANEESMIPEISQGISSDPNETAYSISVRSEKSGKYISGVVKNQDQMLIEPIVSDLYNYNMRDPNVTKGKGNYKVKAMGFTSFQNRMERLRKMQQFLSLILSDERLAGETKIRVILESIAKALDIDPDIALLSLDEKKEAQEQNLRQQQQVMEMEQMQLKLATEGAAARIEKDRADANAKNTKAEVDKAVLVSNLEEKHQNVLDT